MTNARHKLFNDFPLNGTVSLSVGEVPTPYHVYDGHGLLACGTADLGAVEKALQGQEVYPVRTKAGKAVMGIFVCDFQQASLGPHVELQISALVSRTKGETVSDHPFALPAAMVVRPEWGTVCLHIWNDTETVVAYNRDYLGLNPELAAGQIDRVAGRKIFSFSSPDGHVLLKGEVNEKSRPSLTALFSLSRLTGLGPLMRIARQPYVSAHVVNLKSDVFPENRRAPTYTAADVNVLQRFDPHRDEFTIADAALQRYGFTPHCYQHISPFRFVYLRPEA